MTEIKYGCKDYFYTINSLKYIGLNKVIGNNLSNVLWDYVNAHTQSFCAISFCILDDITRIETGTSIMRKWADDNNITTYTNYKDETTGKNYLYNTKTHKTEPIKKRLPRYLKIVK